MSRAALAARIAGCAITLGLAGCGVFGIGGGDAPKPTPLTPIESTVAMKAAWTTPVGKALGFSFTPEIEGGRVYAAAADGGITMIEEDTGKVVGRIDAKRPISGGLAVEESKVIVGTSKGDVIAFDPTGKTVWTTNVTSEVIAPASVSKKTAVIRTADGRIVGINLDDGKRKWVYQRPMPVLMLRSDTGVQAIGNDVLAGYPGGKLIALDIDTGQLTWEVTVSLPKGATELERIADISGVPVVDGARVCAAAFQGKVACFEIQTRNMVWSRDIWSSKGLAVDGKNIYIADDTGNVHALDKNTGASLWKQDKLLYRRLTAPLIVAGRVAVGDIQGFVHVLSVEDGKFIGRIATDGSPIRTMIPAPGGIVVQTANGSVVAIRF
ncbi:Outer membrane protein assembly factor BamB [Usitatibacter rugosus]|uniref:Outer membrane protein assembly factor BamB n=1 Tax=Usitatibacter rugosus TaxID=2732067 RepID=A0A6M4GZ00_9PROT|nr:outer membrane protein assembly factor BamB [Usitatibacter rugosus]QJR11744.1 Outer membrane protein assembly factor BamB [Usitatibacter rugosus]